MIENNKDSSIDISPVTEKSKRINKFVIMIIVFLIGALILYLFFGGKEKKKTAPVGEVTTTTNTTSFITPEDMEKLATAAQSESAQTAPQSQPKGNMESIKPQQRTLTAAEKNEMVRQRREWENAQKEQAIRAKEDDAARRSEIFFKIPAMDQGNGKKSEPAVNHYYNSGDENYIQVVGGN